MTRSTSTDGKTNTVELVQLRMDLPDGTVLTTEVEPAVVDEVIEAAFHDYPRGQMQRHVEDGSGIGTWYQVDRQAFLTTLASA